MLMCMNLQLKHKCQEVRVDAEKPFCLTVSSGVLLWACTAHISKHVQLWLTWSVKSPTRQFQQNHTIKTTIMSWNLRCLLWWLLDLRWNSPRGRANLHKPHNLIINVHRAFSFNYKRKEFPYLNKPMWLFFPSFFFWLGAFSLPPFFYIPPSWLWCFTAYL